MKLMRTWAIAKKEIIQIMRDPLSLMLAFLMPVIMLVIFGYAITMDVNNLRTAVYDRDHSYYSREFIRQMQSSGYFSIVGYAQSNREIDHYLDASLARVVITIPEDFSKTIRKNEKVQVQILVDGSDSNTATIALGYLSALSEQYARQLSGVTIQPLIDPRVRVWYNDELKSRNFIIPGLISVIMAVIAALLTSMTIAREWERGTMEQLISTPVKTIELMTGKLIPYFMIGLIDMGISIVMALYVFHVPFRGSMILLIALASLFLFGTLSFGILVSSIAKNQLMASQFSIVTTYLPAFLLSGFMFSIYNMPQPLQYLTYIIPARYFIVILKGIFLKGVTFELLKVETLMLALYGIIIFTIANVRFKKRID
jgi:ABC-2 type transport system permease protein